MQKGLFAQLSVFLKQHKFNKRWKKVLFFLSIIVVFCTTYMLILPAITLETETVCGITEHTHSDECYSESDAAVCELQEHIHSDECYSEASEESTEASEELSEADAEHIHTEECFTVNGDIICSEWGKEEPWGLDWESEEFKDKAVKYVEYLINLLPAQSEFESKLDEYETAGNESAYEDYYAEVYAMVSKAFVNYENLSFELRENVCNAQSLLDYEWLYIPKASLAVTETRTVEFVNYYDNATSNKTILIHSNSVGDISSFGFYWWYAVVVDENEYGDLVVTAKYDYNLTNKSSLAPSTEKGFVLLSHGDSNVFDCAVGDEATVDFAYLNTTAGYNASGYGTVTFSEYVPAVEENEEHVVVPDEPSDYQISEGGGTTVSADKEVTVSKTIDGTELENVFDITLTVKTQTNVQTFLSEPDMAVVIVMDISNTMNTTFTDDTMSRYDAAVTAASEFINQFAENTSGLSQIGFVAFNTHAHEIFELQPCSTSTQAALLISEMSSDTDAIVSASGYGDARTRFTNVEGGLKRAYDMLETSGNANQYVILLTDGFPTTYLVDNSADSTNYNGYEPYSSSGTVGNDGVFYDSVLRSYCKYGTSYSDKASIKAREMATYIKGNGAKIFSVGVDVAGQTVQAYINSSSSSFSIVDRTGTTYEIGGANDLNAYKNWLGNSIGSGYYYDSTDQEGITSAFNSIFEEIRQLNTQSTKTVWTATDPLPILNDKATTVEFIHFFDINGNAVDELVGVYAPSAENTADYSDSTVHWDLKKSGYTTEEDASDSSITYYYYTIKYRVRLRNEENSFVENSIYKTNDDAFLEYRTITSTSDNEQTISDVKTVSFMNPSVFGYLSELMFSKQNYLGEPLEGAQFTILHDPEKCPICRGDGTSVTQVTEYVVVSDAEGTVSLSNIPSGHTYTMVETAAPEGYVVNNITYVVNVDYDKLTVTEVHADGTETAWTGENDVVINYTGYVLPETGGIGTTIFYIVGGLLIVGALIFLISKKKMSANK